MNKYLLMSAAAALASTAAGTGSASASSFSVHYGTSTGSSYCDGIIGASNGQAYWGHHTYTTCGYSHNIADVGIGGKKLKGGIKKAAVMSDDTFAFIYGNENYAITFQLQTPVVAGNHWNLWVWFGFSSSAFLGNQGITLPGQFASHKPGHKSQNTVSKLTAALKMTPVVSAK